MSRFPRAVFAALLLTSLLAGAAGAEITLPVNDNNTGVFDQPSAVLDGATARVAYIGDNSASGAFKVYYAAVNGNANFQNLSLVKDAAVIPTSATVVDNTTSPNSTYFNARHPKILMRSSTQAVILFQAQAASALDNYRPYIALLTLSGNTVNTISVKEMIFPAGVLDTVDIEDLSFGIVTSDNTARIAFATKATIGAAGTFQVYFARVGLDNATVYPTSILQLSSLAGTDGFRPLPSLRLDTLNRAHVAWAANASVSGPAPVFYAMIKETNGIDNRVISATQVLAGSFRWSFPSLQVFNNSSIVVVAADNTGGQGGNIGFINFNPDADDQNGSPVSVATNTTFFITPPGELILPDEFNLYHPDAFLDTGGRIHLVGYGVGGTRSTYFAFHLLTTSPFFEISTPRTQVGFDSQEYPGEIAGDYTRAAFVFMNAGKAVVFWSGINGSNRNLDVTTVATTAVVTPAEESGCSMVPDPRAGERGRMAGAAFLFLPAAVLAIRRISRRSRNTRGGAVSQMVRNAVH